MITTCATSAFSAMIWARPKDLFALEDGSILVVEGSRGNLTRVFPSGDAVVVAHLGGGPNGAAMGPDNQVYICNNGGDHSINGLPSGLQASDYVSGSIQKVDLASGGFETIYDRCDGIPLRGPNDIVMDSYGGFWFTDFGKGRPRERDNGGIYYGLLDGSGVKEVLYPRLQPNGIGLSPDGTMLYWSETASGRLYRRHVIGPGEVAPVAAWDPWELAGKASGIHRFDSLALEASGSVCVATLGPCAGITVIGLNGVDTLYSLPAEMADPICTNICFGGPDMRSAFITTAGTGRLLQAPWGRPGLILEHQQGSRVRPRPWEHSV